MIPAPQLFDRDVEAIGDGDERVAATNLVALRMPAIGGDARRYRDDELVTHGDVVACGEAACGSDVGGVGVQRARDALERFAALDHVETPARAPLFGDGLDALQEDVAAFLPGCGGQTSCRGACQYAEDLD